MYGRGLPRFTLHEFTAQLLAGAIDRELARLELVAAASRDRADRNGWALTKIAEGQLRCLRSELQAQLDELGPMLPEDREEITRAAAVRGRQMPRSKANAASLRETREH